VATIVEHLASSFADRLQPQATGVEAEKCPKTILVSLRPRSEERSGNLFKLQDRTTDAGCDSRIVRLLIVMIWQIADGLHGE